MRNIIACKDFSGYNGKTFQIEFMQAAYNVQTKEARIYAEFERVREDVISDNLQRMGAASIVIDSFSSIGWDFASQAAIKCVVECGETPGFTLFKQGNEPIPGAAGRSAAAGNTSGDDEAHAPESPPSGGGGHGIDAASDEEAQYSGDGGGGQSTGPSREGRHKRVRSVTPPPPSMRQRLDDDGGRIRNCEMFSVFRTMYEDSRLLRGELPDLREKVVAQKYELDRSAAELLVQRSKTADFEEQLRLAKREVSSHEGELNDLKAKVAGVDKTIGDLKEEHAAAIKAKDEEALTARKLLMDELDAMLLAKVVIYFIPCVCIY